MSCSHSRRDRQSPQSTHTRAFLIAMLDDRFGAEPEAADFQLSFRCVPKSGSALVSFWAPRGMLLVLCFVRRGYIPRGLVGFFCKPFGASPRAGVAPPRRRPL